jgi:hypothetical protein
MDGEVVAVWGCSGASLAAPIGYAWLFTGRAIERVPFAFARELRYGLKELLTRWPVIVSGVAADYEQAVRFMRLMGFRVGEPYELNGVPFYTLEMER